jgi:hypothetical protein
MLASNGGLQRMQPLMLHKQIPVVSSSRVGQVRLTATHVSGFLADESRSAALVVSYQLGQNRISQHQHSTESCTESHLTWFSELSCALCYCLEPL